MFDTEIMFDHLHVIVALYNRGLRCEAFQSVTFRRYAKYTKVTRYPAVYCFFAELYEEEFWDRITFHSDDKSWRTKYFLEQNATSNHSDAEPDAVIERYNLAFKYPYNVSYTNMLSVPVLLKS